jgi:hypothetical protein
MRNVLFLNLCTCKHLDSVLLDVLGLTGALVLEVAGPRVDGYLVVPCLLVGGLDLDGEGPRVDGKLGPGVNGVVLAAFTAWVSTSVSSSTYFL